MATISFTKHEFDTRNFTVTWAGFTGGDTCVAFDSSHAELVSWQMSGFGNGGGLAGIYATNDASFAVGTAFPIDSTASNGLFGPMQNGSASLLRASKFRWCAPAPNPAQPPTDSLTVILFFRGD